MKYLFTVLSYPVCSDHVNQYGLAWLSDQLGFIRYCRQFMVLYRS